MIHHFALDPRDLSPEQHVEFSGPAGRIEGLWRPSKPGVEPAGTVVVAHPHPAFGGTMMNKVVFHTARVLNHDLNLASLRFNFRGTGRSEGTHDQGRGEIEDLAAAWEEARRRIPGVPRIAAGFSFGAAMTLLAAARAKEAGEDLPAALALVGIPLRLFEFPRPFPAPLPLAAVHGERDQFTPPEKVREYLETWPGPAAFQVFPEADHFLEGHLVEATAFLRDHIKQSL